VFNVAPCAAPVWRLDDDAASAAARFRRLILLDPNAVDMDVGMRHRLLQKSIRDSAGQRKDIAREFNILADMLETRIAARTLRAAHFRTTADKALAHVKTMITVHLHSSRELFHSTRRS
jgi:hypothetical protein